MKLASLAAERELGIYDGPSGMPIEDPSEYEIVNHLQIDDVDFFTLEVGCSYYAADDVDDIRVYDELADGSPETLIRWIADTHPAIIDDVDDLVNDLESEYMDDDKDGVDSNDFVGQHRWFIRCNGKKMWTTVETQSTYFDDANTMESGAQLRDVGRGEDETDEEFLDRVAQESKPPFPREAVKRRVLQMLAEKYSV